MDYAEKFFGAKTRVYMGSATVGTTAIEIIPAAPQRVAIAFGPCTAGNITIGPVPAGSLVSGLGFIIQPNAGLMDFKFDNSGNAPAKPWSAIADAAGRQFGWLEILLE
jgi:hypothetical protein